MKHLFLISVLLISFANANLFKSDLSILDNLNSTTSTIENYLAKINDSLNISAQDLTINSYSKDKQIRELLDMLKNVVTALFILSATLIILLVYFIYNNLKFKNQTIKELEKAKEQIENSTIKDPLTGLCNKKYFEEIFNIEYAISTREKSHLNFFIIEINDFENYIKTHSKEQVTDLINDVTNLLKIHFKRVTDSIFVLENGIFGGLILAKEENEVKLYLKEFLQKLEEHHESVNISIGLKINHINEKLSKESIYSMANHALIEAKERGAGQIVEFDETLKKVSS